jgi:hypothetical protein
MFLIGARDLLFTELQEKSRFLVKFKDFSRRQLVEPALGQDLEAAIADQLARTELPPGRILSHARPA